MKSPFIQTDPIQVPLLLTPLRALAPAATHRCFAQRVELEAALWALELYPEHSLNIYTDSKYVFMIFHTIETAIFSQATAEEIFHLFL